MRISSQVFGSNHAEKIFRIFTFEDLIKKAKLPTLAAISKKLQSQFLTEFFFWRTPFAFIKARHTLYLIDW